MRTVPTSFKRTYLVDSAFKPITPRQYIIAFEGVRTEPQYFDGLRRYIRRFGISGLSIQCIPLVRSYLEEGCSHPKLTLKLLETYLDEVKNRAMSIDTLAKHAVDWAVDICAVPHKGKEVLLRQLKNQVVEKLVEKGYSSEQQYSYDNLGIIVIKCYQILIELLPITLKKQKKKSSLLMQSGMNVLCFLKKMLPVLW